MTKMVTDSIIGLLEKVNQEKNKAVGAVPSPSTVAPTTMAKASDFDAQPEDSSPAPLAAPQKSVNLDLFEGPQQSAGAGEGTVKNAAQTKTDAALKAAFVQWIGSQAGAQAPRDVVAWVTDKDLLTTDIQSLEVRLLINKQQLDSLRETLKTILAAGRKGQISGEDFFSSLQAAAASTARDPEMIKRAKSLAQSGLVPEFLVGLPYKSRIMDMTNELWGSWSVDEQDMFLADLEARIMAYETIHDGPEGWVQLNKSDDPSEYVYPISLELLP
jgi:uncharacterized protein YciI